jgi:hypothetical protein
MTFQPDDHELAGDDCEPGMQEPNATQFAEGLAVYDQQLVSGYRSIRHGNHVKIIYLETRRHRSGNSILGTTQKAWLYDELIDESVAHIVIASPIPWNGPDHAAKQDNYCGSHYRGERDEIVAFMVANGLISTTNAHAKVQVICADRHKLYHTVSPEGLHEHCVGALNLENAQSIPVPGDPSGTDPEATMTQIFSRDDIGGFGLLEITTVFSNNIWKCSLRMNLHDEYGVDRYQSSSRIRSLPV